LANYVIGDIQGCYDELLALVRAIGFNPENDQIHFVGDLVNRGPKSLAVLRWVYENRANVTTVLGNHDLHLLACWMGFAEPKRADTIADVLESEDADVMLAWLQQQPLLRMVGTVCIVHAGIYPGWSFEVARLAAAEAHAKYSGKKARVWFKHMYGNKPVRWSEALSDVERFRFTVNALTRMRFCRELDLDLKFKGELADAPADLKPWFTYERQSQFIVACGHWSALGLLLEPTLLALDTGCIWGGKLTAIRLEDRAIFQVDALLPYQHIE
jgi:bis(5'-nucleosyl)-tetraphosphatase (symmetrical)